MNYMRKNWLALSLLAVVVVAFSAGLIPDPALAGALGGMPFLVGDTQDVSELLKAFEDFKSANDERLKAIEKNGFTKATADPLIEAKVNAANADIEKKFKKFEDMDTELRAAKARTDALEATLKRVAASTGEAARVEAKHLEAYRLMYSGSEVTTEQYLDHKKAVQSYMRKGSDTKLIEMQTKALSVDSQPDGGFWVMPDTTGRIVQKVFESSPVRQFANVQAISTDALEGDYDLDEAGAGWTSERGSRVESTTPQVGQWRIPAHELYAEPRATQKLLDDASVDPEAWLAAKVSNKFARTEATAFVTGTGAGQPRGFLTYANGVPSKAAWKVIEQTGTGVSGAFAATPNGADVFLTLMGTMKEAYLSGNVVWAMNRTTRAAVRKLKDSQGRYFLDFDASQTPKQSIFGIPVAAFEDMPVIAAGSLSIALANFAEAYQIVDRIGIRVLRDPYTAKPFVKFYTTKRVGGDVINHEAIKLMVFT